MQDVDTTIFVDFVRTWYILIFWTLIKNVIFRNIYVIQWIDFGYYGRAG